MCSDYARTQYDRLNEKKNFELQLLLAAPVSWRSKILADWRSRSSKNCWVSLQSTTRWIDCFFQWAPWTRIRECWTATRSEREIECNRLPNPRHITDAALTESHFLGMRASYMQSRASRRLSFMIMVPSIASFSSERVVRTVRMTWIAQDTFLQHTAVVVGNEVELGVISWISTQALVWFPR